MGFSTIPLPKTLYDVEPGGRLVTSSRGTNALIKDMLENQYYAPKAESEINNRNALTKGQNIENEYMPEKLRLANAFQELQNKYYGPNIESEMGSRNALTRKTNTMLPLEAEELRKKNAKYNELTDAQIQNYKMGGRGGMGVGAKDDMIFNNSLQQDNKDFSPEDLYVANGIVSNGQNMMPDGRKINVSPATQRALDRALRSTTTAAVLTGGVKANQAEAELKVLNDYAQKGLKPYGDTIAGYSPQQIMDTFKKDKDSQMKMGRFVASQALQYEAAQNRIRLANGQPGVTSTEGLMQASGQRINSKFPQLSYVAREEAARYLDEALAKGLEARKSVGVGASTLQNKLPSTYNGKSTPAGVLPIPAGMVRVRAPDMTIIDLPPEGAAKLVKDHPDHKIEAKG